MLIEHAVIGQQLFAIHIVHHATADNGCGVVQLEVGRAVDKTHNRNARAGGARKIAHCLLVCGNETCLQHQVLGWIPGDRQFGKHHNVATRSLACGIQLRNLGKVGLDVAHRGVHLGQGDAQFRCVCSCHVNQATDPAWGAVRPRNFTRRSHLGNGVETAVCETLHQHLRAARQGRSPYRKEI